MSNARVLSPNNARRRRLVSACAVGIAAMGGPGAAASVLIGTPAQTRGPFYPLELPLDSDNDLVRVKGRAGVARGEITDLVGQVLDRRGRPAAGTLVEIWQCDANGRYHHPWDRRGVPLDENFQGYGSFVTDADGRYRFRTIKPVAYPGRAPHIHFSVKAENAAPLVTQMYVAGAPENPRDGILNRIRDPNQRQALLVDFRPNDTELATLKARFDIVLDAG